MSCNNMVIQYVPSKYHMIEIEMCCGSTGVGGEALWCRSCKGSERVRQIEEDSAADNAWLQSAGWGEM